jgi:hypothetical protein
MSIDDAALNAEEVSIETFLSCTTPTLALNLAVLRANLQLGNYSYFTANQAR